jgi:hypothetical protein
MADAIVLGPSIRKARLELDRNLVEKWAKEVPYRKSIISDRLARGEPKLLVVLEEWITPTWTYAYDDDAESCAVGLSVETPDTCPRWAFAAIAGETVTAPARRGNTVVRTSQNMRLTAGQGRLGRGDRRGIGLPKSLVLQRCISAPEFNHVQNRPNSTDSGKTFATNLQNPLA